MTVWAFSMELSMLLKCSRMSSTAILKPTVLKLCFTHYLLTICNITNICDFYTYYSDQL